MTPTPKFLEKNALQSSIKCFVKKNLKKFGGFSNEDIITRPCILINIQFS
jgi:hypothetical protein